MPDHDECDKNLFADDTTGYEIGTNIDNVLTNLQSELIKFDN